jgi:hypothetical protein
MLLRSQSCDFGRQLGMRRLIKKVLRRLLGSGCIEPLIQFHGTSDSHGERAYYDALGCR